MIITIFEVLVLLLILTLVGKSVYKEFKLREKEKPLIIRFFGTPIFLNIIFILIILFPTIFKDILSNSDLYSLQNLYICLLVFFLIYQSYVSSEILIFSHGLFYLGNYISFKQLQRVELVQLKNKYSIEMISENTIVNLTLRKRNATRFYDILNKKGVNIYI